MYRIEWKLGTKRASQKLIKYFIPPLPPCVRKVLVTVHYHVDVKGHV